MSDMTVKEAGMKGGRTVKEKYGPAFFSSIGKKGGKAVSDERGPEFYSKIGKKGWTWSTAGPPELHSPIMC